MEPVAPSLEDPFVAKQFDSLANLSSLAGIMNADKTNNHVFAPEDVHPAKRLKAVGETSPVDQEHATAADPASVAAIQQYQEDAGQQHGIDVSQIHGMTEMIAHAIQDQSSLNYDFVASAEALAALTGYSVDSLQSMTGEQLQAFAWSMLGYMEDSADYTGDGDPGGTYKNWWDEHDEKELKRLMDDVEYRTQKFGIAELDWTKLEEHFGRSQNALRKKYWMLSRGVLGLQDPLYQSLEQDIIASPPLGCTSPQNGLGKKPRAERKKWTEKETEYMLELVRNKDLRIANDLEGLDGTIKWDVLARLFNCEVQPAKRKYRSLSEQEALRPAQEASPGEKTKRVHHKKSVPYRWMIVQALSVIHGMEGTALDVFDAVERNPSFVEQLDTRIMPGTKHVPRWKIQVRKVLSADPIFINTGTKQKHETVWKLDPKTLSGAEAERQRQRAGIAPIVFPPDYTLSQPMQAPGNEQMPTVAAEHYDAQHLAEAHQLASMGFTGDQAQDIALMAGFHQLPPELWQQHMLHLQGLDQQQLHLHSSDAA